MAEIDRRPDGAAPRLFSDAPEADEAEQDRLLVDDAAGATDRLQVPFDADPADAMEQSIAVPLGEDEYR